MMTITAGLVLLAAFLAVESRATHALLPFRVLANRTRAVSFLVRLLRVSEAQMLNHLPNWWKLDFPDLADTVTVVFRPRKGV